MFFHMTQLAVIETEPLLMSAVIASMTHDRKADNG